MSATVKKVKKVCECKNCGNEAEMTITCSLEDVTETVSGQPDTDKAAEHQPHQKVKGTGVCSHCGNESDMWIDL
ncbi:MAG: hypothetical protein QNI95_02000 [Desulfobacterales bacterium]|nr:hypothetical protein [Desulfobacterales bacterium]